MPKTRKERRRRRKGGSSNDAPKILILRAHATWCGHCTTLKPKWEEMEKHFADANDNKYTFKTIENTNDNKAEFDKEIEKINEQLNGEKWNVDGFPSIASIKNGKLTIYNGERETEPLIDWVKGTNNQMGGKKGRRTQKRRVKKSSSFKFW